MFTVAYLRTLSKLRKDGKGQLINYRLGGTATQWWQAAQWNERYSLNKTKTYKKNIDYPRWDQTFLTTPLLPKWYMNSCIHICICMQLPMHILLFLFLYFKLQAQFY